MMTAAKTRDPSFVAGLSFAEGMARISDASQSEVLDALAFLPENMLDLLCSPEGWTALAEVVRADLCIGGNFIFKPTVH